MTRLGLTVRGVVQGVGFRPFVRREALAHGLAGWVQNRRDGVRIEVQGGSGDLASFVQALRRAPEPARVETVISGELPEEPGDAFQIVSSAAGDTVRSALPPDLATCEACLAEVVDPRARRHGYPFTNCTRCGPRWSIVTALPYDRDNTTMQRFALCEDCRREYPDVDARRYHAQPIACPTCGPRLSCDVSDVRDALASGAVVALRGLGGFQLLVDATDDAAMARLRERKHRPDQPMAVMFRDLDQLRIHARITEAEAAALCSPAAPIVLVEAAEGVTPWLGAMLPTTPLHHLILRALDRPVVCTSANRSTEPMCLTRADVNRWLSGVPDLVVDHDRPIARPVDDSVVRAGPRGVEVLRRGRGYAPHPVAAMGGPSVLAVGAHMNSTVAVTAGGQLHLSQHLGHLAAARARDLHADTVRDLCAFVDATPERVACDLHPDYASTRLAEQLAAAWSVPLVRVQHHHAHIAAVMAEHALDGEVLGLAWDGIGLGDDGTLWGGEALACTSATYRRVDHLAPFPLPGGERAMREPARCAIGLLHTVGIEPERFGLDAAPHRAMLERGVNAPHCTSMGRLFDAVAAMLGLVRESTFDAHAALALEACATRCTDSVAPYPPAQHDMVRALADDITRGVARERIARRFHLAMVERGVEMARRAGLERVVLGGGCFANRLLADGLHRRLDEEGFEVYAGRMVPPGDNGIAAGQAFVAARASCA